MEREAAVAGRFYPGDAQNLKAEIEKHLPENSDPAPVLGVVSPHAGFVYSGDAAGAVYARVAIPDTVVLLGPNHTGHGERMAVMTEGRWNLPTGAVEIDSELAAALIANSAQLRPDADAHREEHSLETQIPFLQHFKRDFKIVPVCMMRASYLDCKELARALVKTVRSLNRPVLVVASSDMTHYESHLEASAKDSKAIAKILDLDAAGLFETVIKNGISMCGVGPVTTMLLYAQAMGAEEAELVRYMTSGEVSGDMDRVVGYAGMIVK